MSTIVTRAGKGSPLTHVEVDANFTNLNTDKVEKTAADITGGTINGTTIGATTPSSVNATTITGQTEILNGTGQNLVTNSQVFTSNWNLNNLSATSNSTTAPDSTNTGSTITASAGTSILHQAYQGTYAYLTTSSVVFSIYAKAGTNNFLAITVGNPNGFYANFNVSNGTVGQSAALGTGTLTSATATSVGNGWYRLVIIGKTVEAPYALFSMSNAATYSADGLGRQTWTSAGTETVFVWGAQLEYGTSASAYTVTTSALVFNRPNLSFNNAAQIGMEYNGNLYLQPNGTGALQAQATTSTTAGGNARGTYAVDWQTVRNSAARVASATISVVSGGNNNTAQGYASVASGGETATASGAYSFVGGGSVNTASATWSTVVGGTSNTSGGLYNFIGGGFTNSGTANAAVTTQSGTMNATTAVTLSGSNANIKVGQYITGTSIAGDTYVAAISGTALTLSKNASGSSTSTLSFFTPHGVVVGGGNNQATGSYSFIGGGGDAGTAANRNVASGDWSFVGGGRNNTASGGGAFVGGGGVYPTINNTYPNTASGIASAIVGGLTNTASGEGSFIGGGASNSANGRYSSILGGAYGTARSITGNMVFPATQYPISATIGVTQSGLLLLGKQTTDATATVITSDGAAGSGTNQVILPNNSAYFFTGEVVSGVTGGGNTKGWTIEGVIKRGANAASTALVGTPTVTSTYADAGASTWTIAVTADTTNGGLRVTFTGQASTTIRTVCRISTVEMTF